MSRLEAIGFQSILCVAYTRKRLTFEVGAEEERNRKAQSWNEPEEQRSWAGKVSEKTHDSKTIGKSIAVDSSMRV